MSTISTYREISRLEMPEGSFVYGQLASIEDVDAPSNAWLVCTDCERFAEGGDLSQHWTVLVAHFIYQSEDNARYCAAKLAHGEAVGPVTLVSPLSRGENNVL